MAAKNKQADQRRVDWSLAPRGAVSATMQATAGLVAVAGAGELAHVSPVWAATGAAAGALGHVVVGAHRDYTPGALLYRIGCWTGAGAWLTWVYSSMGEPWNPNGLAALAVGAVGVGVLAPLARMRTPDKKAAPASQPGTAVVPRPALAVEWEYRFRRVCRIEVSVTAVTRWDNGAGYDVHALLPPGPATRKQISSAADALATDSRLLEGCGVEVQPGPNRGSFVLAVATVNRLGEAVLPHPDDYSPRSILDPVPLGEHRDSTIAAVSLREDSMLVTGRKGGGKTNLLDVLTLGVGRCQDALNWHIDMNGGGMSQAWLHAWLEGEIDRPPIDWCAANAYEALLMTTVALAIAKDRKSSYRTFKMQSNSKLLPVSALLPEIVISVDEGAEVLSPTNRDPITRQIRNNLEEIQRIGRNEAVNVILSTLRPTQDMIVPAILKQSAIRVGLYGLDEADLGHLYGWNRGLTMADLPSKGCLFLGDDGGIRPSKAWLLDPGQIAAAARAIAAIRPDLDAAGVDVANAEYEIDLGGTKPVLLADIYADRHDRMRKAFTGQAVLLPAPQPTRQPAQAHQASRAGRAAPAGHRFTVINGGASAWPDPINTPPAPATATVTASAWPDPLPHRTKAAGPAVSARPQPAGQLPAAMSGPGGTVPEPLARLLAAFDAADDHRMHSEVLAAAVGAADVWALAEMLRPYGVTPLPQKFTRAGVNRRGYSREDVATAIQQAIAGGPGDIPQPLPQQAAGGAPQPATPYPNPPNPH